VTSRPDAAELLQASPDPAGSGRAGLGEEAYLRLRDAIVSGELQPHDSLSEAALAKRLRTSRTPVREALARLSTEGLVQLTPGRGARVTDISLIDIRDLFQLREALEGLAARLAAANAGAYADEVDVLIQRFRDFESVDGHPRLADYYELTSALDQWLVARTGNRRLELALRDVWTHSRRLRQYASHDVTRLESSAREHVQILEAVRQGDGERAEAAVRLHLANSRRAILDKFLGT
jgi:DNA-binding GntR family transcriptional regulator